LRRDDVAGGALARCRLSAGADTWLRTRLTHAALAASYRDWTAPVGTT